MKKMIATVVTSLALSLSCVAPVFAQARQAGQAGQAGQAAPDPAAVAAAQDLFESMNYRTLMTGAMKQMSQGMGGAMRSAAEAAINGNATLSDEEKAKARAKVEENMPKAIAAMQSVISDPTLVDDILAETIPLYARTYSADELKQIAAFYRTPVGAKMMASMPQLMSEGMQIGQRVMATRIGPMMKKMQEASQ